MEVAPPWGLGLVKGTDEPITHQFGSQCTAAAYGHSGARSSVAFVEPTRDLVVAVVTNGAPSDVDNTQRLCDVSDAIHSACH